MDRSYLSQSEVIAASREFVCIRLATYENAEESALLKSLARTRSGELENSVFTILAPDGKRQLARAGRSPKQLFSNAQKMAETMNRIAREYPPRDSVSPPALPLAANVRLGLDIAACDNQPLVVLFAPDAKARQALEERVRPYAWNERFLGHFVYASSGDPKDLSAIEGVQPGSAILIIQPDRFGQKGKVLRQASAAALRAELVQCLQEGADQHRPSDKSFALHVREGHLQGVFWDTALPVTDPEERQARERGRRQAP
jgi:hypothetical protein